VGVGVAVAGAAGAHRAGARDLALRAVCGVLTQALDAGSRRGSGCAL
jgi:hypothetical protein